MLARSRRSPQPGTNHVSSSRSKQFSEPTERDGDLIAEQKNGFSVGYCRRGCGWKTAAIVEKHDAHGLAASQRLDEIHSGNSAAAWAASDCCRKRTAAR